MNAGQPVGRAVFFSGEPDTISHIYRVEHAVAALRSAGWSADWVPLADPVFRENLDDADVAVVFRAGFNGNFSEVRKRCTDRGIPLVYDTDDLIFDPDIAADGRIALLDGLGESDFAIWMERIRSQREALVAADHATLSTDPLAAAAGRFCKSVFVLPNVVSPGMWKWAAEAGAKAEATKDPTARSGVRLIFASGTRTHHRDFKAAAWAVSRILAKNPVVSLTVLGELDMAGFPELAPFAERIEARPCVPFHDLFVELVRADINLCPLEPNNPFCDAKSAVRCLAASAVGMPSIVSPTPPLLEAVENGRSGLVARDPMEWESALDRLIADSHFRIELGRKAQTRAREISDFPKLSSQASGIYLEMLGRKSAGS